MTKEPDNMNDEVVGASQEAEEKLDPAAKVESPKKGKQTKTCSGKGLSVSILLGLIAIGVAGYTLYEVKQAHLGSMVKSDQALLQVSQQQAKEIEKLQHALAEANQQINQFDNQTAQVKASFNGALGTYQGKLNALMERINRVESTYLMPQTLLSHQIDAVNQSAASLYLGLADEYAMLSADSAIVENLLSRANDALVPLGQQSAKARLSIQNLRQHLSEESETKTATLIQRLEMLSEQLDQLKMKAPGEKTQQPPVTDSKVKSGVMNALSESWERFKSLVTVEKLNQVNEALIDQQTRSHIQHALRMDLQQAERAAFEGQNDLFTQNMQHAQQLVKTYFSNTVAQQKWLTEASQLHLADRSKLQKLFNQAIENVQAIEVVHSVNKTSHLQSAESSQAIK